MTTPDEVSVRRIGTEGGEEVAVFEFQGELRDLMVNGLRDGQLVNGRYVDDAKRMSPQGVLSLAAVVTAGGATAISALASPTLFMATANPATLMALKGGVGSAVMGANGIVAQAPFIPVAASLPVVAPIMAMQAMTAVVMLQQFHSLDRKLETIKNTLDTAIARSEATHAGELVASSRIVDEVYRQYELAGEFSTDMLIRLALAERDVSRLSERFRYLVDAHSIDDVDDIADVRRANYDAHSAMLASFLGLRVAYLRVSIDVQENPKSVAGSLAELTAKIADGVDYWERLLRRSESMSEAIREREGKLSDMNWVERHIPEFVGGKGAAAQKRLAALKDAYVATLESELALTKGFDSLIQSTRRTLRALENPKVESESSPTMVYWRDEDGEHSFYSHQLKLV